MAELYAYAPDSTDYTTLGMVGALPAETATFEETANAYSEIDIELPIDAEERHRMLRAGCIIAADVPVPYTPSIDAQTGMIETVIETYTVSIAASKTERQMYKKRTGDSKLKVAPQGVKVAVLQSSDDWDRWKIKTPKHGTGWISKAALTAKRTQAVSPTVGSLAELLESDGVKTQYFRIYDVSRDMHKVHVRAQHISYDLNDDVTRYKSDTPVKVNDALQGILAECSDDTADLYTIRTNIGATLTQASTRYKNPINALIDPDDGIAQRVGGLFVRDNFDLYLLAGLTRYRGFRIEYGINMQGITYKESWGDVRTRIICTAEDKNGKLLTLDPEHYASVYDDDHIGGSMILQQDRGGKYYFESIRAYLGRTQPQIYPEYAEVYPVAKYEVIDTGLKESDQLSIKTINAKMIEAARAFFEDGGDLPGVQIQAEYAQLSEDERYRYLRTLEALRLHEIVRITHKAHGIDTFAQVRKIKWDILRGRMTGVELETIESEDRYMAKATDTDEAYDTLMTADGMQIITPTYTVG